MTSGIQRLKLRTKFKDSIFADVERVVIEEELFRLREQLQCLLQLPARHSRSIEHARRGPTESAATGRMCTEPGIRAMYRKRRRDAAEMERCNSQSSRSRLYTSVAKGSLSRSSVCSCGRDGFK